jgi:ABC-type lipoprotein export system ATPase subunit
MSDSRFNGGNERTGNANPPVLTLERLRHRLWDPERNQEFVVSVERLEVSAGSFVAILGPNACGKTTLLTVIGLLRKPTNPDGKLRFSMRVHGEGGPADLDIAREWQRPRRIETFRRKHLGFALQSGELLSALTVRENIALPLHVNGWNHADIHARVQELLEGFDLLKGSEDDRLADSRVNKLSGGEYQRVALARAIVHRPDLVFVDEPTASLNRQTARRALRQLNRLQHDSGGRTTVIMITHDEDLAKEFADSIVRMEAVGPTAGQMACLEENRKSPPGADEA